MLETCKGHGLVKARSRRRTDSTHVLAAIRTLDRLGRVGETLRAALNGLAAATPHWLRAWVPPGWFDRYASRSEESRLAKGEEARHARGEAIGADGSRLLEAVHGEAAPRGPGDVPAVEALRRVWLSQFYLDEGRVRRRKAGDLAPAGQRIDSQYDPEASFGHKPSTTWTGSKVHLTETCEDDQVHLITDVETTPAVAADVDQTAPLPTALAARGCCRPITCRVPATWTASCWWTARPSTTCGWSGRCVRMGAGRRSPLRDSSSSTGRHSG
jgi:transposase